MKKKKKLKHFFGFVSHNAIFSKLLHEIEMKTGARSGLYAVTH